MQLVNHLYGRSFYNLGIDGTQKDGMCCGGFRAYTLSACLVFGWLVLYGKDYSSFVFNCQDCDTLA